MVNAIRASEPCGLNKIHGSNFRVGSRVRLRTYRPKRCGYNKTRHCEYNMTIQDKYYSPKPLNKWFYKIEWMILYSAYFTERFAIVVYLNTRNDKTIIISCWAVVNSSVVFLNKVLIHRINLLRCYSLWNSITK